MEVEIFVQGLGVSGSHLWVIGLLIEERVGTWLMGIEWCETDPVKYERNIVDDKTRREDRTQIEVQAKGPVVDWQGKKHNGELTHTSVKKVESNPGRTKVLGTTVMTELTSRLHMEVFHVLLWFVTLQLTQCICVV